MAPDSKAEAVQTMTTTAAERVFGIAELREMILLDLTDAIPTRKVLPSGDTIAQPALQLFSIQMVNHAFEDTVKGSQVMQQRMWLSPPTNAAAANGVTPHFEPLIWLMSFFGLCHHVSRISNSFGTFDLLSTRTVHQHEFRAWPRAFKLDMLGGLSVAWRQIPASFAQRNGEILVRLNLRTLSHTHQTRRYAETGWMKEVDNRTLGDVYDRLIAFMLRTPEQHDTHSLEKLWNSGQVDRW